MHLHTVPIRHHERGVAVATFVDDLMKDPKNLDSVSKFEDAVYPS